MSYVQPIGAGVYALFVAAALYLHGHPALFTVSNRLPAGKFILWFLWLAFTAYSIYCMTKENLFQTIGKLNQLHWGRQIGMDLYIGLSLFLFLMYLHQGSFLVVLLWLLPALAFVNLATLLYFAIHYDSLIAKFFP